MDREQKVTFIETNYPELYKYLEANASEFLENVWMADINSIENYNAWVAFYCGQISDPALMKKLLI